MDLPPLRFHRVHSRNLRLGPNDVTVSRVEHYSGIAFSSRPVRVNEKVCIRIVKISNNWKRVPRFGFTTDDPTTLSHCLYKYSTNKNGNKIKALEARFCLTNNIFHYYVNSAGDIYFGVNGEDKEILFTGIETRRPLWSLVEVCGRCTAIQYVQPTVLNYVHRSFESSLCGQSVAITTSNFMSQKATATTTTSVLGQTATTTTSVLGHPATATTTTSVLGHRATATTTTSVLGHRATATTTTSVLGHRATATTTTSVLGHPATATTTTSVLGHPVTATTTTGVWKSCGNGINIFRVSFYRAPQEVRMPSSQLPRRAQTLLPSELASTIFNDPATTMNTQNEQEMLPNSTPIELSHSPLPLANEQESIEHELTGTECTICCENPINSVLYTCGHMCMCYMCALDQWQGRGSGQCPLCRATIRDVVRTFRS